LSDARSKYLALQRALGGNEIILSEAAGRLGDEAEAVGRQGGKEQAVGRDGGRAVGEDHASRPTAQPPSRPSQPPSRPAKHWSLDAPPIPTTPGILVPGPEAGLLAAPSSWNTLEEVAVTIAACRKCFLCEGRKRTVPGEGNPKAQLMFVGEGPGQTEDETGRPFVGRAGELLTQIIEAIELKREDVFIANVVKCRPPQNRKPLPDEMTACWGYLERQIELIEPRALVALGATAAEAMLRVKKSLTELRGRVHSYRGIPLVVTYHPAALLRNPNWKKPTWDDIRIARQLLDR
jgi:uracil-DNA glycosylase